MQLDYVLSIHYDLPCYALVPVITLAEDRRPGAGEMNCCPLTPPSTITFCYPLGEAEFSLSKAAVFTPPLIAEYSITESVSCTEVLVAMEFVEQTKRSSHSRPSNALNGCLTFRPSRSCNHYWRNEWHSSQPQQEVSHQSSLLSEKFPAVMALSTSRDIEQDPFDREIVSPKHHARIVRGLVPMSSSARVRIPDISRVIERVCLQLLVPSPFSRRNVAHDTDSIIVERLVMLGIEWRLASLMLQ
nr:hypothetical protein CFP56_25881 [Quercus suber]